MRATLYRFKGNVVARSAPHRLLACLAITPMLLVSATTHARLLEFEGTLSFVTIAPGIQPTTITRTGVAIVNEGGVDLALNTLRLAPGAIAGTATVPVTDPEVTATIASLQLQATMGAGVFHPFSAAVPSQPLLTQNILPLIGSVRVCQVLAGCGSAQQLFPLQQGAAGVGVGGVWSGGPQSNRVSVQGAPWTVGTALLSVRTEGGGATSISKPGFVHGAHSFSGSTALPGGAVQFVTPVLVHSGADLHPMTMFASATLRFVPEPSALLLLSAGAIGLVSLGHRRVKK